jgi:nicotinate-nucleotide adenylyltransferase
MEMGKSENKRMKIGLFGGTFNPPHLGHLRSVEEVRAQFQLDKIVFIPAGYPPHKSEENVASAEDRYEMLRLTLEDNPHFEISDIEMENTKPSYTIDTLRKILKIYPQNEFFFIVGLEVFQEISTWKDYKKLFPLTHFIVMIKDPLPSPESILPVAIAEEFCYSKDEKGGFRHRSEKWVYLSHITRLDISSTKIRKLIGQGEAIQYLVPKTVERYIRLKGLYR